MMNIIEKMSSNVELNNTCIHVYRNNKKIGVCQSGVFQYTIVMNNNLYIAYVTGGDKTYKMTESLCWTEVLKYIKAFEGCLLYAKIRDHRHHGIDLANLHYLKEQYTTLPLTRKAQVRG